MIKLITGIIAQVQAAFALLDSAVAGLIDCCCGLCKALQLFLQVPAQQAISIEVPHDRISHFSRYVQYSTVPMLLAKIQFV